MGLKTRWLWLVVLLLGSSCLSWSDPAEYSISEDELTQLEAIFAELRTTNETLRSEQETLQTELQTLREESVMLNHESRNLERSLTELRMRLTEVNQSFAEYEKENLKQKILIGVSSFVGGAVTAWLVRVVGWVVL